MLLSFILNAFAAEYEYSGEQILLFADVKGGKNFDIKLKREAENSSVIISPIHYKRYTYKCSEGGKKLAFDIFGVGELSAPEAVNNTSSAPISTITLKGTRAILGRSIHIDIALSDGWQASLIEHTRSSIIITFNNTKKYAISHPRAFAAKLGKLPNSTKIGLQTVSLLHPIIQEEIAPGKMIPIPTPNYHIAYTPDATKSPADRPLADITGVDVEVRERQTILNIETKGALSSNQMGFITNTTFSINFANATTSLPNKISLNRGIIREVTFKPQKNGVMEMLVELTQRVSYNVNYQQAQLKITFESPPLEQLVELSFDEEDIRTVLLMLSKQYNVNIVAGDDVTGNVTIHTALVPLKYALRQILQAVNYTYVEEEGGFLRIVRGKDFVEPTERQKKTEEEVQRKIIWLTHANATAMATNIQKILTTSGNLVADERTNSLVIIDTPENLAEIEAIVAELDVMVTVTEAQDTKRVTRTQQTPVAEPQSIMPELKKKIFELNYISPGEASLLLETFLSEHGEIRAVETKKEDKGGGKLAASVAMGGFILVTDTAEVISNVEEMIAQIDQPVPQVEIQAYIVEGTIAIEENLGLDWRMIDDKREINLNLPFTGEFPALSLQVGNLSADDFASVLKVLSSKTDTKVLSNPKIMTVNNRPAIFQSGDEIPYTAVVVSQNVESVATNFKKTGIILEVSTSVKGDDIVSLTVLSEVSDISGFTPTGQPRISKREASTQVLVKDGDTAVIGGLVMERFDKAVSKVPILGDIPLLGRIFSTTNKKNIKSEITIFITPKIVRQ